MEKITQKIKAFQTVARNRRNRIAEQTQQKKKRYSRQLHEYRLRVKHLLSQRAEQGPGSRAKPHKEIYIPPEHVPPRWQYFYDKLVPDKTLLTREIVLTEAAEQGYSKARRNRNECQSCETRFVCPTYQVIGVWSAGMICPNR